MLPVIFFDDSLNNAGVFYGNWSFELDPVDAGAVPLPAGGLPQVVRRQII